MTSNQLETFGQLGEIQVLAHRPERWVDGQKQKSPIEWINVTKVASIERLKSKTIITDLVGFQFQHRIWLKNGAQFEEWFTTSPQTPKNGVIEWEWTVPPSIRASFDDDKGSTTPCCILKYELVPIYQDRHFNQQFFSAEIEVWAIPQYAKFNYYFEGTSKEQAEPIKGEFALYANPHNQQRLFYCPLMSSGILGEITYPSYSVGGLGSLPPSKHIDGDYTLSIQEEQGEGGGIGEWKFRILPHRVHILMPSGETIVRTSFLVHPDANWTTKPGSAGCIVFSPVSAGDFSTANLLEKEKIEQQVATAVRLSANFRRYMNLLFEYFKDLYPEVESRGGAKVPGFPLYAEYHFQQS